MTLDNIYYDEGIFSATIKQIDDMYHVILYLDGEYMVFQSTKCSKLDRAKTIAKGWVNQ